jgi:basic amino acid/polyamine antiporter, APA family
MSFKEPFIALGIAAVWGIYGAFHFLGSSKKKAKPVLVPSRA